jgi:hypothetical protein
MNPIDENWLDAKKHYQEKWRSVDGGMAAGVSWGDPPASTILKHFAGKWSERVFAPAFAAMVLPGAGGPPVAVEYARAAKC